MSEARTGVGFRASGANAETPCRTERETNGIHLACIEPGKLNQNAYIERFNRSFREEVLTVSREPPQRAPVELPAETHQRYWVDFQPVRLTGESTSPPRSPEM